MLKKVLKDTIPLLGGYLVLGIGFGIIMSDAGYGVFRSVMMSVLIYAGSMQYAAVGLLTGGASLVLSRSALISRNDHHF